MSSPKVVLLTESDSLNRDVTLPYKYYGQKLWETIRGIVNDLHYRCESVELHKLDFQEHESVNKFSQCRYCDYGMIDHSRVCLDRLISFLSLGFNGSRSTTDIYVS